MATSKEKEKEEEKALEEFRSRQGFIPYYSDTFFEEISNFISEFSAGIVFGILMLELLIATLLGRVFIGQYLIMLGLAFAYVRMRGVLESKMKRFGYQMQEDEIILTVWGKREVIPYTEIQRALMTKPVKMTIKDIQVPYSHGYIRFPYEVGIAKQQKNIMECYEVLRKTVSCEMPTMTKENISYFDKMYAYNSSFRNSCFGFV